ncbi:hypothetical protein [Rhodococcus pyridinivorans]|uniref:hypothetical protein n=1 Tax=Rhodococcus pyridinivorans TaxID=103816 RepID=UPI001907970F|nr:hypothetical protein [Rhodococcus pyridinivorans]QQM54203.1 hypothetical protein JGU70_05695 [Rhodococcus pyridinivorans]
MREWWEGLTVQQKGGGGLTLLAIVLTFVVAGGAWGQPVLIAVFAAVAQFGAAGLFAGHGKADPSHAQASVRRLFLLGKRAAESTILATEAFEQTNGKLTAAELKAKMGRLSSQLSYIEEDAVHAIEDWRLVHPQAVKLVEEGNNTNDD